jgi:hypothetical protein
MATYTKSIIGETAGRFNDITGALLCETDVNMSGATIDMDMSRLTLAGVSDPYTLTTNAVLTAAAAAVSGVKHVVIMPSANVVGNWAYNKAASGSTAPLLAQVYSLPCNETSYGKINVAGSVGTIVVLQFVEE